MGVKKDKSDMCKNVIFMRENCKSERTKFTYIVKTIIMTFKDNDNSNLIVLSSYNGICQRSLTRPSSKV